MSAPRILGFATQGAGGNDEARLRRLLAEMDSQFFAFDYSRKAASFRALLGELKRNRDGVAVMEGTGIAGGGALLLGRMLWGSRYVVSTGDAPGPFVAAQAPLLGPLWWLYEFLLCRYAAGYIGWTPYLAGRALSFGSPRAITAAGFNPFASAGDWPQQRSAIRRKHGIPEDAIVFGIAGSLAWNRRYGYCYGYELVRAMEHVHRKGVFALIVGGGAGLERLRGMAGSSVILTGPVAREEVPAYLSAMDAGSLPQSLDGVGSFRYTTKLSEYLAARLPVVTGQTPVSYDLDGGWLWRLPGDKPWGDRFIESLANLMQTVTAQDIERRRSAVPGELPEFDESRQVKRVTAFLEDLLAEVRA
ncbi:MAG: glycosyltransferase [Bryobacteraceae bacterium]